MSTAAVKLDRAAALGWSRAMPHYMGPCRWIRTPRKERHEFMAEMRRYRLCGRVVLEKGEGAK